MDWTNGGTTTQHADVAAVLLETPPL